MPMAAKSAGCRPRPCIARAITSCERCQISSGSCSTQPGLGQICRCSCCSQASMRPEGSNTMKRVLVVPWSMAPRYLAIGGCLCAHGGDLLLYSGHEFLGCAFPLLDGPAEFGSRGRRLHGQLPIDELQSEAPCENIFHGHSHFGTGAVDHLGLDPGSIGRSGRSPIRERMAFASVPSVFVMRRAVASGSPASRATSCHRSVPKASPPASR